MEELKKQQQEQVNEEDLYILNPSIQNVNITPQGKLIDIAFGSELGIWDPKTGRCLQILRNVLSTPKCEMTLLNDDLLVMAYNKQLKIFNHKTLTIQQKINLEYNVQAFCEYRVKNKLLMYNQSYISIFDIENKTTEQFQTNIKITRLISLTADRFITLDDQNNLYQCVWDQKKLSEICAQGQVFSLLAMNEYEFAIGRNQSIHIMDANKNCIKDILKGYDDTYLSMRLLTNTTSNSGNQLLASGSAKGMINIWDIKRCRCIAKFGDLNDTKLHFIFQINQEQNLLITGSYEQRKYRVWDISKIDSVKQLKCIEGELKNVQKVARADKTVVAMLLARGQYINQTLVFIYQLEIVDFMTNEKINLLEITNHKQSVEADTMSLISTQPGIVYFLTKGYGQEKSFMNCWNYEKNNLIKYEFNVEEHKQLFFLQFERIVIPFQASQTEQQQPIKSGLAIYDFQVNSIFKINFQGQFLANVVDMVDKNNIIFLNQKNQLEFWDIDKKVQKNVYDLKQQVFTYMKFVDKFIFFLNPKGEFLLWEQDSFSCIQRRKANKDIIKIELFNNDCLILYKTGVLELWNVDSGDFRKAEVNYFVQDFIVNNDTILLIGEGFMQISNRLRL